MRAVVRNGAALQPRLKAIQEKVVGKIHAPEGVKGFTRFAKRRVQIQEAHEAGPLTAPVRDSEDRTTMAEQTGHQMLTVLPDGLDHDQRNKGIDCAKYLDA